MKFKYLMLQISTMLLFTSCSYAIPLWTINTVAEFPPKLTVAQTATALVKYKVINNSSKPHQLLIKPLLGVKQNSLCELGPKGSANSSCILELTITGSAIPAEGIMGGPVLCQIDPQGGPNPQQCEEPCGSGRLAVTLSQGAPVLTASPSNLLLSVSGLTFDSTPSGQPRVLTITNTGSAPAIGLTVQNLRLPQDASVTSTCDSLAVGSSCSITITPGSTGSLSLTNQPCTEGTEPVPAQILVQGLNTNQVSTDVVILGYGCIYQGGYIYSLIENINPSQSIGGKVLSRNDLVSPNPGIFWDSSNACEEEHNCQQTNATSLTNGSFLLGGNSYLIYQLLTTNQGVVAGTYAAGLCEQNGVQGYNDWYLPAICELGYDRSGIGSGCGDLNNPLMQNVTSNLIDPSVLALYGNYWSSTESTVVPNDYNDAWYEYFDGNIGLQDFFNKWLTHGVRCSRVF